MQNNKNVPLHILKDEEHPYTSSGKNSSFLTSSHHGGYNSGNGGGGNMDDHVTHRELDKAADSLQKDIKLSQDETSMQITELSGKIDTIQSNVTGKIDKANSDLSGKISTLATSVGSLSKIAWWIMGIISAGIIVPFVILLVKTIFKL